MRNKPRAACRRVIRPQSIEDPLAFPSSLYVERDVRVAARRSGVIEQVLVDRGESVRAGQPLAVLERDVAEAELEIARQDLLLAETELRRVQPLYEQKIASISDFDRARIARDKAAGGLAEASPEYCTVRALCRGGCAGRWLIARAGDDLDSPVQNRRPGPARLRTFRNRSSFPEVGAGPVDILTAAPGRSGPGGIISPAIDPASGTCRSSWNLPGEPHFKAEAPSGPLSYR
jgi:pyruvate/2-oxoglutarate dehydrogenase complex dihydrolipoamide acyltransferase (E2) component